MTKLPSPPKHLLLVLIAVTTAALLFSVGNTIGIFPSRKPVVITFTSSKFEHEETLKYSKAIVKVSYPQIESGLSALSTRSFNEYLKDFTTGTFEESRYWFNVMDVVLDPGTLTENSIFGDYKIIRSDERFISIRFNLTEFGEGMVHPYEYTKVINYSVKDNKDFLLSDLFRKDSHYLEYLSSLAKQKIIDGYKADNSWDEYLMMFINGGTEPKEGNFRNFVIGNDYLLLIFDPYAVGPYGSGTREAKVTFTELSDLLNEEHI